MEIECPYCEHEFYAKVWKSGECPNCGEEYYWDEFGADYDYAGIVWERSENNEN